MRNIILGIILLSCIYAGAQKAFSLGVTGNMGTDRKKQDYSNTPICRSTAFGGFLEYKLGIPISLSLGMNIEKHNQEYAYKDSSNNTITYNHNFKYYSFPLIMRIFFFKGIFYSSGLALNNLKEHESIINNTKKMEPLPAETKTISCIQEIGAYYAIKQKLVISVTGRYTIPMSKDNPVDNTPGLFSLNASLAFKFSKTGGDMQLK